MSIEHYSDKQGPRSRTADLPPTLSHSPIGTAILSFSAALCAIGIAFFVFFIMDVVSAFRSLSGAASESENAPRLGVPLLSAAGWFASTFVSEAIFRYLALFTKNRLYLAAALAARLQIPRCPGDLCAAFSPDRAFAATLLSAVSVGCYIALFLLLGLWRKRQKALGARSFPKSRDRSS